MKYWTVTITRTETKVTMVPDDWNEAQVYDHVVMNEEGITVDEETLGISTDEADDGDIKAYQREVKATHEWIKRGV